MLFPCSLKKIGLILAMVVPATLQALPLPLADWKGLTMEGDATSLAVPGEASLRHADGRPGVTKHGFRIEHDGTFDWQKEFGLRFDVKIANGAPLDLVVRLMPDGAKEEAEGIAADVTLRGGDWQTVTMPWSAFDFEKARTSSLRNVKEIRLRATAAGGGNTAMELRNFRVIRADTVGLETPIEGLSVPAGETASYPVTVANESEAPQSVVLKMDRHGWEGMEASVEPTRLDLQAGEKKEVTVRVHVPNRIPPGANEKQVLSAVANGEGARGATLQLVTTSALAHPYILHTASRWQEVRKKVQDYDWARKAQADYVARADKWEVPEIAKPPKNDPDDTYGPFLFPTTTEHDVMATAIAWQLTGDEKYAEKVKQFLLRLSDPGEGYAKTFRACNQSIVQEGHFFQHVAMAYDMVLDAGVIDQGEQNQINQALRLFVETIEKGNDGGSINNWNLSELCGAFYGALTLQDLATAERLFAGPSGIVDQLAKGTMDDGWWYECSIGYNVWCASEFSQAALAYEPFGVNFRDMRVPANFSGEVALSAPGGKSELNGGDLNAQKNPYGMTKEIWGPLKKTNREIRDLWNSLLPFVDYRGVMFGVNDSTENLVTGSRNEVGGHPFELAYYLFRDPAYADIVKRGGSGERDLLYGVPELPKDTPKQFRESTYADNVGVVMLRSQAKDRPIREQIQAVLHYGTHGWAHGHFDRTGLLHLSRYGRSFFNPEMVWFGYEPFMYKFYVQTSVASNMVTVDQKMQEPVESKRLLFYSGTAMQATAVETNARWSNPPYGGMVYDYVPVKTFEEKTWREGRFVPLPKNPPAYGALTDYTEKILQRRVMVVTDDYVVLADYAKGEKPHTFENLFQMKGFQGLEAAGKKLLRHDDQWTTNPLSSAQFVTDCNWYAAQAPARASFRMFFGPGADNAGTRAPYSEDGRLNLNVTSLWPREQEIMIGATPEDHGTQKRLFYTVRGDGKILAEGKFGAWILGRDEIDVPLEGVNELVLETRTELAKNPTLFWGGARIVTKEGKEIPLSELTLKKENAAEAKGVGLDYFGGPIKIAGEKFDQAVAAEPKDDKKSGTVTLDLTGLGAVRFKAAIGGDYPLGDESQRRKTYAIRSQGTEAKFLTVIEPFESKAVIKSASASGPDALRVELTDGRVQEIAIKNLEGDGRDITVSFKELTDGKVVREEATP